MNRFHAAMFVPRERGLRGLFPATDGPRIFKFSAALMIPVQVQGSVRLQACDAHGSKLALEGAVVLAGLSTTFRFEGGTHRSGIAAYGFAQSEMTLIPPGEWFTVAASSTHASAGPGAPLRIRFHDGDGTSVSEIYDLGACDAEPRGFALSFHVPAAITVEIATDDPYFRSGSRSTVRGHLVFLRGILARCLFSPGERVHDRHGSLVDSAEAVAIPVGRFLRFPEQPMPRITPAHPLRSLSFSDGIGHPLGRFVPRGGAGNGT